MQVQPNLPNAPVTFDNRPMWQRLEEAEFRRKVAGNPRLGQTVTREEAKRMVLDAHRKYSHLFIIGGSDVKILGR